MSMWAWLLWGALALAILLVFLILVAAIAAAWFKVIRRDIDRSSSDDEDRPKRM